MGPKNPRWRRGCAHVPPSRKNFNLLKLLIISIHVSNFSFLTQLLPGTWSPLFAIGLKLAPRNIFFVFSTRPGFLVSSGFLGIFGHIWQNLRHSSFSPYFSLVTFYYQFTDDTKFHGTETTVVMIFILLLFHLFRTTSAFSLWHWDPADM